MRIGINVGATPDTAGYDLQQLAGFARQVEARGFSSLWLPNIFNLDAVGACAIAGWSTSTIELGTAVTPTYPRHPGALAQQAMTTQLACGGRFTLGIGLSHRLVIEDMFGMSYDRPARHMDEYLQILVPLLRGEAADFDGEQLSGHLKLETGETQVPLLVAALGPAMLKLAGRYAEGTTLWMTGPKTVASHIVPGISAAASAAGRSQPRIVCGLPICLASDADAAREHIAQALEVYGMLPSYRAMLDREGVDGPADLAIVGDEAELRRGMARLRDAGVTDFNAVPIAFGDVDTGDVLDVLQSELP